MDPDGIERCPDDGVALVTFDALAESDGDPFLGATIGERFVILGRLGAGSMGTVYRARQEGMARHVAVKILRSDRAFDAQAKARFTREARAMSLLTSPHTVTVFDFGEITDAAASGSDPAMAGSLYLAMELLDGESLGARLKRKKRLPTEEAARIARHALRSLAEAHEKGVIHRDLKPDNLFLVKAAPGAQEEICKLLDFGIAKVVQGSPADVDSLETQAGTVFGTPRYMSPEQAQGKPLDGRSDLYSVGVLLYQMLVGRAPFADADAVVVMARHIKTAPVAPIDAAPKAAIPRPLSDLVVRVLAKEPKGRPPTADAFIEELDAAVRRSREEPAADAAGITGNLAALSRDDLTGRFASPLAASRRARRRFGLLAASAAGGALVASIVVAGAMRSPERAPELARAGLARSVVSAAVAAVSQAKVSPAPQPPPEAPNELAQAAASVTSARLAPAAPPGRKAPPPRKAYTRFE